MVLINGGKRLHILLSMLFRSMLIHGYNANDLVLSSIISIPKDIRSSLSSSDYRGISSLMGYVYCLIVLLCIHVMISCILRTCNLGLNHNTPQQCAALFITKSLTIICQIIAMFIAVY